MSNHQVKKPLAVKGDGAPDDYVRQLINSLLGWLKETLISIFHIIETPGTRRS
ncbi:hypothetical protein QNH46_23725 [Paenibacillus woosongensis]|uniref:Uncharacterized protein n=1 Tax=Paenibacillus woosongensis TaxID=307580 RepID=A0AA95L247_9BACL|nr:hypothetical protein [Paenibacillus woosongensis]WHX49017.1 hypothetical protein QNH46_23725 [Paenibacillus woosongensis]